MSEHEQQPNEDEQATRDETVEDLEVPEGQQEDVGGGMKIRQAPDDAAHK